MFLRGVEGAAPYSSRNRKLLFYSIAVKAHPVKWYNPFFLRIGSKEVIDLTSENLQLPHKLTLNERSKLTMTGVTEVVSFDDMAVVLRTALGTLEVQGQELKLKTLSIDGGQVAVDGLVTALVYEEPRQAQGLLRRLFG